MEWGAVNGGKTEQAYLRQVGQRSDVFCGKILKILIKVRKLALKILEERVSGIRANTSSKY